LKKETPTTIIKKKVKLSGKNLENTVKGKKRKPKFIFIDSDEEDNFSHKICKESEASPDF